MALICSAYTDESSHRLHSREGGMYNVRRVVQKDPSVAYVVYPRS
jgi:hypothetical protein